MAGKPPTTSAARNRPVGSPQTKGNNFLGAVNFLKSEHASHWQAVLDAVQPSTRETIEGMLIAGHWYPFEAYHDLTMSFCRQLPGKFSATARQWGAYTLERDLSGGIYRAFLRAASPRLMVKALSKIWGLYQGTGAMEVLDSSSRQLRALVYGLHLPSPQIAHGTVGASVRIMELAGGRNVRFDIVDGATEDDHYCEFTLTWA